MTHDMQQLHPIRNREALAWLHDDVLAVLYAPSPSGSTFQGPAGTDAFGCGALRRSPWPGSDIGVRAPDPQETPLSWQEVRFGCIHGLFHDESGTQGVRGQV